MVELTPEELSFWQAIYLTKARNYGYDYCTESADKAIEVRRKRFKTSAPNGPYR